MRLLLTIVAAITASAIALNTSALAQTAMFEDLVVTTVYNNGSSFTSNGITFNVDDFTFSGGGTTNAGLTSVINPNQAGADNGMNVNNVNLDVVLPGGGATAAGFAYAEFGGNINLTVNGLLFNTDDFVDNHGFSNSEFSISVNDVANKGFVSVSGDISQFSFGGQELEIDDVRIVGIPEPTTIALAGLGFVCITCVRRKRL